MLSIACLRLSQSAALATTQSMTQLQAAVPTSSLLLNKLELDAPVMRRRWLASGSYTTESKQEGDYLLPHPRWTEEELKNVSPQWEEPKGLREWIARTAVRVIRFNFDLLTGFKFFPSEKSWLYRMVFLETIAGVPGFCGAAIRHLRSLRAMERDHGWIHSLVGEAENERMHLLTFLELKKPGLFMRLMVALSQGIFWNAYFAAFLISPKFAFSIVANLEVEAVKTYTHCLEEIESGILQHWKTTPAPEIAKKYWGLGEKGTVKDLIYHIRADEAMHRHVNHTFSRLEPYKDKNPFTY